MGAPLSLGTPPTIAALLVLVTLLAGCSGGGPANDPAGTDLASPTPTFGQDTGAIHGVALTDEQLLLADAEVGLTPGDGATVRTTASGEFAFSELAPGSYTLQVQKIRYQTAVQRVDVVAGQVAEVTIRVQPLATDHIGPFPDVQVQSGALGCGVSTALPVLSPGVSACSFLEDASPFEDRFLIEYTLNEAPTENIHAIVFQMQWQSTQPLGKGLSVILEVDGCVNAVGDEGRLISYDGVSPMRLVFDAETVRNVFNLEDRECVNGFDLQTYPKNCGENSCVLVARVFSGAESVGNDSPVDIGVTSDQVFDQYVTIWYNGLPAGVDLDTYTAIE